MLSISYATTPRPPKAHGVVASNTVITMAYKFVLKQKLHSNVVNNVLFYEDDGAPNLINANQLVTQIVDAWIAHMQPNLASTLVFEGIDIYFTSNAPGTPGIPSEEARFPIAGSSTADASANQLALLLRSRCVDGPPWRGRLYLAGWPDGAIGADGLWQAGQLAAAKAYGDALQTLNAAGQGAVARVIYTQKAASYPVGSMGLVNANEGEAVPATQTRRRLGRGS